MLTAREAVVLATMVDILLSGAGARSVGRSFRWWGVAWSRIGALALLAACLHGAVSAGAGSAAMVPSSVYAVPAVRQALTSDSRSVVAHDNEVMALAPHFGRLFAATDQWEYAAPAASGQVLVKNSSSAPWRVFEQTQSRRVQALDSFTVPTDRRLGRGHALLVTQAIVNGRSRIQWLLDGARSFTSADSYALPSTAADVRSFGAHESGGAWAVYAGVSPTGILRGTWSPGRRTLVFNPAPELTAAPPGSPGLKTQKVTGFADCAGALYVSINTKLYRRNDGILPRGVARWVLVYQEPPVGPLNSGLRGLTCVTHGGSRTLLVSTEGNGDVFRLDHLPRGQLHASAAAGPGHGVTGLVPTLEFVPASALRRMLAADGTVSPATGRGSVGYVIAAYNNFETIRIAGRYRQFFGLEWAYRRGCPTTRICAPSGFDAAACFAVRTDRTPSPTYVVRCLTGRQFAPSVAQPSPVGSGQAFVSIRTVKPSPFGDGRLYYGGYDCNFHPADGAAWIGTSAPAAVGLDSPVKAAHS